MRRSRRQQKRRRVEDELKEAEERQAAQFRIRDPDPNMPDPHPIMLNDSVLTHIFKVCSLTDLRQFRLVSKQWYSQSLPILRKDMVLQIDLQKCDDDNAQGGIKRKIKKFQIGDHPFEAYTFVGFKFQHLGTHPETETQLLSTFGTSIRKLTLTNGVLSCVCALQQVIFEQTPNLEELCMGTYDPEFRISKCSADCKIGTKDNVQVNLKSLIVTSSKTHFPISWKVMLARFPNLERIHFPSGFSLQGDILPFVEALEEEEVIGRKIKDLKFDSRFVEFEEDEDDCTAVAERFLRLPQMKLEALSIICRRATEDHVDVLPIALLFHRGSLKKLEIQTGMEWTGRWGTIRKNEIQEPYPNFPFQVSSFESMAELTLEGVITRNLHFLRQFPNLKVLRIRQCRKDRILNETNFSRLENLVLHHIRKFEFLVLNTIQRFHISEESMKMLVKIMPNVEVFEGNLFAPGLRVVSRNWRRMRKLTIYVNVNVSYYYEDHEEWPWKDTWFARPLPNIRTLNDLKEITEGVTDDPANAWTDFDELPLLKALDVKREYVRPPPVRMCCMMPFKKNLRVDAADEIVTKYPKPSSAPPLTLNMLEDVRRALDKPAKEKLVSGFSLNIMQEDLLLLNNTTEWLIDLNMDFYLELIKERSKGSGYPKVYIFHSFFYTLLAGGGAGCSEVMEVTGEDDIFKYDIVFFPVCLSLHWRLVVVKFPEKTLNCYDSLFHNDINIEILTHIAKYLRYEYRRKHCSNPEVNGGVRSFFRKEDWQVGNVEPKSIPQQTNAIDCGIFCLQYAEYISREQDFDFNQSHIPYFRKRMAYETLTKKLLTSR